MIKKFALILTLIGSGTAFLPAQDSGTGAADLYSNPQNSFRREPVKTKLMESGLSEVQTTHYIFEARRLEYSGDRPDTKTMESLLENETAVKLRTGEIKIKGTERSDFGSPADFKYVSEYGDDRTPRKYESVKTGLFDHVQIVGLKADGARVELSISDITPAAPIIQNVKDGQILRPSFNSQSMDKGTIELSFGKWFFLPYAPNSSPGFVWALKIEKAGS